MPASLRLAVLVVAGALFTIGVFGIFVNRKNVIIILMSIELVLLSVNINLVAFSTYLQNLEGQIFAMMVLTLPIVIPVIKQLGYDLIWFGVIVVKMLEVGLITPPLRSGMCARSASLLPR